jgi:hypothetical protein
MNIPAPCSADTTRFPGRFISSGGLMRQAETCALYPILFMINRLLRLALCFALLAIAALPLHAQGRPPQKRSANATAVRSDLIAFGTLLESAIKECDALAITGLLDRDALLDAITEGTAVPEPDRTKFFASAAPGLGIGAAICSRIADNGSCRFIGIRWHNGTPHALFRLVTQASAFDYYEFLLKGKGKDVRFTDVFLLSTGELFSERVRKAVAGDSTIAINRYIKQQQNPALADAIAYLYRLGKSGDAAAVLRSYDSLPAELRRDKNVILFATNAAITLESSRLTELLDSLRSNYPEDPSLDLYLVHYFERQREYGSELAAVDQIDRRVHDPWLNILRAKACMMGERYELAKRFADSAIAYDSLLIVPRWVLVIVALKDRDFNEAIRLMSFIALYDNIDSYIAELSKSNVGKEFISSKEYTAWRASRKPDGAR